MGSGPPPPPPHSFQTLLTKPILTADQLSKVRFIHICTVRLTFEDVRYTCARFDLFLYSSMIFVQVQCIIFVYAVRFIFCCFNIKLMTFILFVRVNLY